MNDEHPLIRGKVCNVRMPDGQAADSDPCHGQFTGKVPGGTGRVIAHVQVVPIFWGDYYRKGFSDQVFYAMQLLGDLVGGPFMNGLAQYGVSPGNVLQAVIVRDANPPQRLSDTQARQTLIGWFRNKTVTPEPAVDEDRLMYFIFPPPQVDIGTAGGYHQSFKLYLAPLSSYDDTFWTIISTTVAAAKYASDPYGFVNYIAPTVAHEIVEVVTDRDFTAYNVGVDGMSCEIADLCGDSATHQFYTYRNWIASIPQYYSNRDGGCIRGDQPG